MPLYIKIDFRVDSTLGAWWSRKPTSAWDDDKTPTVLSTDVNETRIRNVLIAIANAIDPEVIHE